RIAHLSDFHFGLPSRGAFAAERAVEWGAEGQAHLVAVTGDLVSRPSGEELLRKCLTRLGSPYVVLGNHDVAYSRDPFSRTAGLTDTLPAPLLLAHGRLHGSFAGASARRRGRDDRAAWSPGADRRRRSEGISATPLSSVGA